MGHPHHGLLCSSVSRDNFHSPSSPVTALPAALPSGAVLSFKAISRVPDAPGRSHGCCQTETRQHCSRSAARACDSFVSQGGHPAWLQELRVCVFAPLHRNRAASCCPSSQTPPALPKERRPRASAPHSYYFWSHSLGLPPPPSNRTVENVLSAGSPASLHGKGEGMDSIPSQPLPSPAVTTLLLSVTNPSWNPFRLGRPHSVPKQGR